MKKVILWALLVTMTFFCSSCATIIGGIIGHQSGELAAGMVIGAAVDFGDDVVRGICYMTADIPKEFKNNSQLNADDGTIQLPGIAFNVDRMAKVKELLKEKIAQNGWTYALTQKKAKTRILSKDTYSEKWNCHTDDGRQFDLKIDYKQDEDAHFTVSLGPESTADKAEITSQIYDWLEQISLKM